MRSSSQCLLTRTQPKTTSAARRRLSAEGCITCPSNNTPSLAAQPATAPAVFSMDRRTVEEERNLFQASSNGKIKCEKPKRLWNLCCKPGVLPLISPICPIHSTTVSS
eukprot:2589826-Rhodomonas_salina.1